jgi:hypothetical protein
VRGTEAYQLKAGNEIKMVRRATFCNKFLTHGVCRETSEWFVDEGKGKSRE